MTYSKYRVLYGVVNMLLGNYMTIHTKIKLIKFVGVFPCVIDSSPPAIPSDIGGESLLLPHFSTDVVFYVGGQK